MNLPPTTAPRRLTGATLTAGVVVSAVCFLIAIAAEVAGYDRSLGDVTDIGALVEGLRAFAPWAWASLGTLVMVATPAFGLLATGYEFWSVSDRRTTFLAAAVLAILAVSAVTAVIVR